jgi:transcriptional regulator with XRE-family HTH domain
MVLNLEGTEKIGMRLRKVRREMSLTQTELAIQAGTNQAVIQKIENGRSLRPRNLEAIAEVLQVNPAWLQFGEPWAQKPRPE